MADIELNRVHNLGLPAARAAAERMEAHLGRKFGLKGGWTGDVLHFERPGVTGLLRITDKDLYLSVTLGFLLKAMKGSIEQAVAHELETLFPPKGPAPRGKTASPSSPKAAAEKRAAKGKTAPASRKKGG